MDFIQLSTGPVNIYPEFITLIEHDVSAPRVVYLVPALWPTMFTVDFPDNRIAFIPTRTMVEIELRAPYPRKAQT